MRSKGLDHVESCFHNVDFVVYSECYGKPQDVSE